VKIVNSEEEDFAMELDLSSILSSGSNYNATITTLDGELMDVNEIDDSSPLVPVEMSKKVSSRFEYRSPKSSLTVIRIQTKE
jgi:alpha-L-arabinofuranosidase